MYFVKYRTTSLIRIYDNLSELKYIYLLYGNRLLVCNKDVI